MSTRAKLPKPMRANKAGKANNANNASNTNKATVKLRKPLRPGRVASRTVYHILLIAISLFFFLPFFLMISTSFKPQAETVSITPLLPVEPTLDGYRMVFDRNIMPFFTYLGNTLFLAVISVTGAVFSNSIVAYSLSRIRWRGRNLLFALTMAVMMMPGAVTMVPVYVMFSRLNLVGTYVPLIAPSFFGSAFAIFLLRQFFMGLPKSLEDAARIDGCSQLGIYSRIFLPLMKPALITIGIFTFTATWNDFLGPLIYLSDDRMFTLQMGLHRLRSMTFIVSTPSLMAMAFLITLPMIILFFFAQKHFVKGVTFSGVKA